MNTEEAEKLFVCSPGGVGGVTRKRQCMVRAVYTNLMIMRIKKVQLYYILLDKRKPQYYTNLNVSRKKYEIYERMLQSYATSSWKY